METTLNFELLDFFKALADANRLKIVGILAQRPSSVEDLAKSLSLSSSTVSHHLAKLASANLVSARVSGHYYIYSLQTEVLHQMAENILKQEESPSPYQSDDQSDYDRRVLDSFVESDGHIKAFPAQEKKFLAILRYVIKVFEPHQQYTEKQVNEILQRFNEDTALLRRSLVDYHFMNREGGGGKYWRIDNANQIS